MESTKHSTLDHVENQDQEKNTNGNQAILGEYHELDKNQDDSRNNYNDSNYQEQGNLKQENDQYVNAYSTSYQNYNYSSNNPGSPNESQSTYNKDTEAKSNPNANAFPGDKPWNRAAKDPTIVQKGTELFVGNLSMDTVEEDLFESFQECGDIIDIRVHKNEQNKKCYAFLRFAFKEMIKSALNKNMSMIKGRKIKVTKSNENSTIFIGNIRKNWTVNDVELKVRRIFPNCEKIEHFLDNSNQGRNRGFCFVVFKNRNEAIKALNYVNSKGGINIDGVPLTCDWADIVDEDDNNSRQIFVSGLKDNVDEFKVRESFSTYGNITDLILSKNHKTSKRKDLAFITFESNEEARHAVENFDRVAHAEDIGDNITVSLAFSQQAMQTKKKIKENRKKTNIPPPMGMQPNPKYNPGFNPHMPQMHNQVSMPDNKKSNMMPQQPMYPNNMMMQPQNNLNPMGGMNPMANIHGMNNIPNMGNMPNMPNLSNQINPMNQMQNKQMIPQQGYPQSNIPNLGNPMAGMNQPQNLQGMQQMNQYPQMAAVNQIPQVNPNQNMGSMYPGAVLPNQMNPNMQPNPNMPQNLNQNQLMYLMGYNQTGYK